MTDQSLAHRTKAKPAVGTLSRDIKDRLREDIVTGVLKPGARLRLDEVRKNYGIGMSPLREALFQLSVEGLTDLEDRRGFRVAPVSTAKLRDITFMRLELECMALKLSIKNGSRDWEAQILSTLDDLAAVSLCQDNGSVAPEWEARHRSFHDALVAACGSDWLLHFRAILGDQWARYRQLCIRYTRRDRNVLVEHRAIAEAAVAREADDAVYLMSKHIRLSTQIILESDVDFL